MPYQHIIENDRCKGCGLCVAVCPKKILEISNKVNSKGYYPVIQNSPETCIACTLCCIMCPDVALSVIESEN